MGRLGVFALGVAFAILQSSNGATYEKFDENQPNIINDDGMIVKVEMDFGIPRTQEGRHPQKFYFVPNEPERKEPRLVVLQSSGVARMYESIKNDPDDYTEFLNFDELVFWDGFHSLAFDPKWPEEPYIYVYYIGYTNIDDDEMNMYPNKVLDGDRPPNWNTSNDRGGCWLVPDQSNYNSITDSCPNYKLDKADCDPLSFLCEMYSRIDRIQLDVDTFKAGTRTQIYSTARSCGGFWGHHWSNIMFLKDGSLVFGMGDHAIDSVSVDPGNPNGDMCYDTAAGAPQGHWNPQRGHTDIGKFLRIFPGLYRTTTSPLQKDEDYEIIAKGVRNVYSSMVTDDDMIWVGDVGNSQAERIFHFSAKGSSGDKPVYNMGWPCLEGEVGELLGSYSEGLRAQYLLDKKLTICDPVYKAAGVAEKYFVGDPDTTVAEPHYFSPNFEFRDVIDPTFLGCRGSRAAISSILWNAGNGVGGRYKNKLFFSDHSKRCLFFASVGEDGKLTNVRALMEKGDVGISHLLLHPVDGRLLMLDYEHSRIISLTSSTNAVDPNDGEEEPSTITKIPAPPEGVPPVKAFSPKCSTGIAVQNMDELAWTLTDEGYYKGTLELGAVQYENKYGETRTRGYNGKIPGPTIKMRACNIYKLTLFNNQAGWPNPNEGSLNSFHEPLTTNLHTHGLHISGMGNADNVSRSVISGSKAEYTYAIPCDHAGGTHFYHAHHHGGITLTAGGGAAGLLIIEDNQFHEDVESRPSIYGSLPTRHLVFQYMDPQFSAAIAVTSGDELYKTTATEPHYLTNGCTDFEFSVSIGRWTRLRMLHISRNQNAVVSIRDSTGDLGCKVALIAKDGIYLSPAGRSIAAKFFFTSSSRADIVVYCDTPGTYAIQVTTDALASPVNIAKFTVTPGKATDSATFPLWTPCRPFYLQDLTKVTAPEKSVSIIFTEGEINKQLWAGDDMDPIATMVQGSVNAWTVSGTELHPFHMHVNPVQLQKTENWDFVDGWNLVGDWVDTISAPGTTQVRFRADRYGGTALVHCHIYEHSDSGMVSRAYISGGLEVDSEDVSIINSVACSTAPECPANPTDMPWCPGNTRRL